MSIYKPDDNYFDWDNSEDTFYDKEVVSSLHEDFDEDAEFEAIWGSDDESTTVYDPDDFFSRMRATLEITRKGITHEGR